MNVQFAVQQGTVYVLEVNPRGSRTIPFVSKAIGIPLTKVAMKVMLGYTLSQLGISQLNSLTPYCRERIQSFLSPNWEALTYYWDRKCDQQEK